MTECFDKIQKDYYNKPEIKRFYWQTQNIYIKRKELGLLSNIINDIIPNKLILEVGCGEGANIYNILSQNVIANFVGVDFSEEKINFCNNLNIKNSSFLVADARNLPFEDNKFDLVFIRDLLHHVNEDRKKVIEELLRVTKRDNTLIILEGNVQNIFGSVFANVYKQEKGMKDSSEKKLKELLKDFNYQIYTAEPSNFFRLLLHYNIGFPDLANIEIIQQSLDLTEKICKKLLPEKNWAYWVIKIKK